MVSLNGESGDYWNEKPNGHKRFPIPQNDETEIKKKSHSVVGVNACFLVEIPELEILVVAGETTLAIILPNEPEEESIVYLNVELIVAMVSEKLEKSFTDVAFYRVVL